ncbi:MAG: DUF2330 domain-containing protein [Deltaproteobacteria bacterium]|nr:DUF2330 domain-containing protein [Deltaproteobacteria bacterium]
MAHRLARLVLGFAVAFGGLALLDRPADACGGFFCSQTPVSQAGEHLLFAVEQDSQGNNVVTAHIQVQYEGAAQDFGWILPLPVEPSSLSVGTNSIFSILRSSTEPRFQLNWLEDHGECMGYDDVRWGWYGDDADGAAAPNAGGAEGEADVEVLSQGDVGPYESVVIRSLNGDGSDLIQWLEDHDYVVPDNSLAPIQSYVNAEYVFLALRLLKDSSVGDIQPIVVELLEDLPCIPLLLTAIAALPDMAIYAWVFGPNGVVSADDFLEVQVNMAAIDWFAPQWGGAGNYLAVATAAMNEAGGRGFVREYAGTTDPFRSSFFREGQFDLQRLRSTDDPAAFVNELLAQGFPRDATMQALLRRFIPMPEELVEEGVTEQQFYNCLECYAEHLGPFDPEAFTDALEEQIVRPLEDVQRIADTNPYVTRLFTTISPEEMTQDPIFSFSADVPDVSNLHVAEAEYLCGDGRDYSEAPIRLTLPDGRVRILYPGDEGYPDTGDYVWVDENGDGVNDNTGSAPANMPSLLRAIRHSQAGSSNEVLDNSVLIDEQLHGTAAPQTAAGGGCSLVSRSPREGLLAALLALALGAFLISRRR